MEVNIVAEGLKYMVLGMGIVFLFLYLMVVVLQFQAKIITKYFPDKELPQTVPSSGANDKKKKVAAIVAAIQHHKNIGK